MVMMKTGSTELHAKLPVHLLTTFQCVHHLKIYSDLAQTFADHPVHDAIAPVTSSLREQHPDFDLYRRLEEWQYERQDFSQLSGHKSWMLDKWKFLPMVHHAFVSAPLEVEWFVLMEADTSLSWSNLLSWLNTLNSSDELYLGSQNIITDTQFAHGGSGVVISRAAADRLALARINVGAKLYDASWEDITAHSCCGDEVLAQAFAAIGIQLTHAWPIIQGETINSIDWTRSHLCTPAVSWHHVSPMDVETYWQFQMEWLSQHQLRRPSRLFPTNNRQHLLPPPYLYRDVFQRFVHQHLAWNRTSWNNLSKDKRLVTPDLATPEDGFLTDLSEIEQHAVEDMDACAEACRQAGPERCIQWMFLPGRCHLGKDLRLGASDEMEVQHWTSGWMLDRVEALLQSADGCEIRWRG
jgi:hypothetical protein